MGEAWANLGAAMASIMFIWTLIQQVVPVYTLRHYLLKHSHRFTSYIDPYIRIRFLEFDGEKLNKSELFSAIQNYLSANSSENAKKLKADVTKGSKSLVLSMDGHEEVTDEFNGVRVWWNSAKLVQENPMPFPYQRRANTEGQRYYSLTFHKRDRKIIMDSYIEHVITEGKMIEIKNRQRKLYTNNPSNDWFSWKQGKWNHVSFEHPATFETLAMETKKKEEIKKDLIKFRNGKEFYTQVGKPWKRGYLLYGPPGTGKSTMVAAMANFLEYDVYDLELTAVKDNTELRRLLIETSGKSIILIEDIDCSLDLTGQRNKKKKKKKRSGEDDDKDEADPLMKNEESENKTSKVTLSGLLNFIDGIWSACGGERIIVFTTNHVDELDPALIRRGRMDQHIEMSYCSFEAFKVLAKNYLKIESHELYGEVKKLLGEVNMTPADVAENLMPKSNEEEEETCLKNLIEELKAAKEKERKKAEEEARKRVENQVKEKENSASAEVKDMETEKSSEDVEENGFIKENEDEKCSD